MNRSKRIAASCLASLVTALGCSSAPQDDAPLQAAGSRAQPTKVDAGAALEHDVAGNTARLDLSERRPERIAGSYVSQSDPSIGILFVSSKAHGKIELRLSDLKGQELVHIEGSTSEGVVLRHKSALALHIGPSAVEQWVASIRGQAEPSVSRAPVLSLDEQTAADSAIVVTGEPALLAEIEARPELALLSGLSRALGEHGLPGHQAPAALPLHAYAMTFANKVARTGSVAPSEGESDVDAEDPDLVFFCTPGDVACCQQKPNDPGCAPEPDYPGPSQCSNEPGPGCHGMCGRGCSCWDFVCGDCCYHPGCATHDNWCRSCSATNPFTWYDCQRCYGPAALLALGGC